MRVWRYLYGEHPLHLLVLVASFALTGYVVSELVPDPSAWWILVWFLGAVVAHDLVLYPLYALADQPLVIARWARRRVLPRHGVRVPATNHVRLPALGAGVLGLIYLPTIAGRGGETFAFAAGHGLAGQYENWLLVTGVLFGVSAVLYALRLGRSLVGSRREGPSGSP